MKCEVCGKEITMHEAIGLTFAKSFVERFVPFLKKDRTHFVCSEECGDKLLKK